MTRGLEDLLADLAEAADAAAELVGLGKRRWDAERPLRLAAHAYHRIDYEIVWVTLRDDIPRLTEAINRWRQSQSS